MLKAIEELEAVHPQWEQWQNHPNNDRAHFKLVCELRPEVESPCVTVIKHDGKLSAILLGRLERTQFAPSLGYLRPLRVPIRVITFIHQGLLGKMNEETARECVAYLRCLLRSKMVDAIQFHYVAEGSALLKALGNCGPALLCEQEPKWSVHWEMDIPEQGDFLRHKIGSKQRWKLRKRLHELESAYPGQVTWRWMNCFDDIPGICARLEEVAARAYQRGLGTGFVDNEEHHRRFALFASQGQLRLQTLEIDGRVRAFWYGYVYKDGFHLSETGYDPVLSKYEVGTLIFVRLSDELAREGIRKLDFGIGDAVYKQRFGNRSWREGTIWLFAPTTRGSFFRLSNACFTTLDKFGRNVAQKLGVIDRVKTAWRRHLTPAKSNADLE